ncbi:MAG: HD domain-containing protein [Candidatus Sulfotelmatobacter sp.]
MQMKEVRDPVHGFIYLNETEMKIVNTPVFQRLRYIRQLAFTHMVYPGAEHSRFAHSMGVMEFATRMFDTLLMKDMARKKKWSEAQVKRNRQLLRLAALLHDTGHAPFSHASEDLLHGVKHEEISRRFILADPIRSQINKLKKDLGITAQDVASFFSAENIDPDVVLLKEIFAGEIDADKLDYLYRDSLFTGVHYGRFDYQRLIQSLCLIEDPGGAGNLVIAIEHGGLHALEAMVLARYFMFTQVYFHKIRRAYDHHLLEFLKAHVGRYPRPLDEYIKWDDNVVFALLRKHVKNDEARRILTRDPFVQAFTTREHIDQEERTRFSWLQETLSRELKDAKVFCDAAEGSPHKFEKIGTYVLSPSTGAPRLVQKESGIIGSLKKIEQYRVFTPKETKQQVHDLCTQFWKDHASGAASAATN